MIDDTFNVRHVAPEALGWTRAPAFDQHGGKAYRKPDGRLFLFPADRVPVVVVPDAPLPPFRAISVEHEAGPPFYALPVDLRSLIPSFNYPVDTAARIAGLAGLAILAICAIVALT